MKRWIRPFKVLGITNANIIINMGNISVTFWNTHVKPYYYYTKDTNISYPKTANNLAKNLIDKPVNKEIPILLDYLKPKRPYWQGQLQKSHFTNNLIAKIANIFINHRKYTDYKFAFKLRYNKIITILKDLFEQSGLIEIESLFSNSILQPLQYDFNKYASISLFKSWLIYEIKKKAIDKSYKKSCFVVQDYNDTKKTALLT